MTAAELRPARRRQIQPGDDKSVLVPLLHRQSSMKEKKALGSNILQIRIPASQRTEKICILMQVRRVGYQRKWTSVSNMTSSTAFIPSIELPQQIIDAVDLSRRQGLHFHLVLSQRGQRGS